MPFIVSQTMDVFRKLLLKGLHRVMKKISRNQRVNTNGECLLFQICCVPSENVPSLTKLRYTLQLESELLQQIYLPYARLSHTSQAAKLTEHPFDMAIKNYEVCTE